MVSISDEELVLKWGDDPDASFKLAYGRYSGLLLRYIFRFTGNQEQAEEIIHEVFFELIKTMNSRGARDLSLKAWLLTVARNKSLNFERKKRHEIQSESLVQAAVDPVDLEERISSEQITHLISHVQTLIPQDLAQTWDLRKQGLDYQQIATELNIPIGTVKSRFHRLVGFFKKELKIEND